MGMQHLNSDILCAIDIKRSGDDYTKHDILQICILPVNGLLKPDLKLITPFWTHLHPNHEEEFDSDTSNVNKEKFEFALSNGLPYSIGANIFEKWFARLGLKEGKRIAPLCHNWALVRPFLIEWLGHHNFKYFFDWRARDPSMCSLYNNDIADFKSESYPFPKHHLQFLCSQLKVLRQKNLYDCLADCVSMLEIYRLMVCRGSPTSVSQDTFDKLKDMKCD